MPAVPLRRAFRLLFEVVQYQIVHRERVGRQCAVSPKALLPLSDGFRGNHVSEVSKVRLYSFPFFIGELSSVVVLKLFPATECNRDSGMESDRHERLSGSASTLDEFLAYFSKIEI